MFVSARTFIDPYMFPRARVRIFVLKIDANIATEVCKINMSSQEGRRGGIEFTGVTCQQSLALTE